MPRKRAERREDPILPPLSPPDPITGIPLDEQARCAICKRPKAEHGRYRGTCLPGWGTYPRNSSFTPEA